jgi:tRNA threonylcarbamoyl adenosine modification protein YeaZ
MKILGLDTATFTAGLAIVDAATGVLAEACHDTSGRTADLLVALDALCRTAAIAPRDLDAIAIGAGPGSFTGLRIGLSAARGIALARNIPAVGIPSLLALSLSAPANHAVTVLLDARRDEAYFQTFTTPGTPTAPARILPMTEARAAILPGSSLIETPFVDIALLAAYGAAADPALHPPEPNYVRDADAKPQSAARIARITP